MPQERTDTPTPEEIEHALVEVLRIFARRGRFLREQRERAEQDQTQAPPPDETVAGDVSKIGHQNTPPNTRASGKLEL